MSTVVAQAKKSRRSEPAEQQDIDPAATPAKVARKNPDWGLIFWLAIVHGALLAAPFTFTMEALLLTVFLHWFTGSIGICLGYHRLLTHGSFETYRPVKWVIALIGGLAGEGSAIEWVANHRKHHALSDKPGDPHSPRDGTWWSHILWLYWCLPKDEHKAHLQKWAPDLLKDPVIGFLGRMFIPLHIVFGFTLLGIGYAMGGPRMAASFVIWGMFVRMAFVLHSTWFVNSASHLWGYRNYETGDDSRNNWWVAILSYGEGWHNNHHAYPRMALHGHKWWEIDTTYTVIRLLKLCGLAWNVVDYKSRSQTQSSAA